MAGLLRASVVVFSFLMGALPAYAVSQPCQLLDGPDLMNAVTGMQAELAKPKADQDMRVILMRRSEIAYLNGNSAALRLWTLRLAEREDFRALAQETQGQILFEMAMWAAELEPTGQSYASAASLAVDPGDKVFWQGRAAAAMGDLAGVEAALRALRDPLSGGIVMADAGRFMDDRKLAANAVAVLEPLIGRLNWQCEPKALGDALTALAQAEMTLGRLEDGMESIKLALRSFDQHLYPAFWARAARKLKRLMAGACKAGDGAACTYADYFKEIGVH